MSTEFDADAKEAALRAESESWDMSNVADAVEGDIPVIDISAYLASGSDDDLDKIAADLARACETVGFWQLVGHGIPQETLQEIFAAVRDFHALPIEVKEKVRMDRADWALSGVGYLPVFSRKLPSRATGNLNEAFLVKGDRDISSDDNQWPPSVDAPDFRATVERFASLLEGLAVQLLPVYAVALGLPRDWFDAAFEHPFWRLRMTHYPPDHSVRSTDDEYGIAPHVDTTFFTLLLQDSPGLTIYSHVRDRWLKVPVVEDAFVVNSGELLKQWTNDRYLSVRHFANVEGTDSRYSIPFFVNATRDFKMECIPTCTDADNPAKYPAISYNESQAVVQGE
ncbi:MAG: isopenicillin N synthase-like dioxygenase [Verrucomicrobiales bacterium]|jgi:isopenicillin N synthase-like dioxygenase